MSDSHGTFFTGVGCMDGRVQKVIADFGKEKFNAEYPDTITEAGLVGKLAVEEDGSLLFESIKQKILISLEKHHSRGIVVHGHEECAGNPVSEEQHLEDINKTCEQIKKMVPEGTQIIPVYVKVNPPRVERA